MVGIERGERHRRARPCIEHLDQATLAQVVLDTVARQLDEAASPLRTYEVALGIVAVTELVERGPGIDSEFGRNWAKDRANYPSAAQGAVPTLYAATAPEASGGAYYGPTGDNERRGPLGFATVPPAARDTAAAARLWEATEELTGVRFAPRAR